MYESVTGTVLSFFGVDSGSELAEFGSDCKSIKFTGIILFFISLESLNEAIKKLKYEYKTLSNSQNLKMTEWKTMVPISASSQSSIAA